MCIFIQYLAFSGTNLLTRCHSASSCFLLFLCFRKVVHEIFLELHGTKTQYLIIPSQIHSQKGSCRGNMWRPDTGPTRPGLAPHLACVWPHQVASDSASSPIYSPSRENRRRAKRNPWKVTTPPPSPNPSRGVLELFPTPCRREKSPPEAFFITTPASAPMGEYFTTGLRVHSSS